MSGRTTVRSAFQNFAEILSWFEPHPNDVALSSERSHFNCTQFPYQGFTRPDQGDDHPDGWSDARNFHICSSRVRAMKTGIRTSRFWMRYIPYGWARPDENPHRPDDYSDLPISVFLERNPEAGRTLSVVRMCCWNVRTNASWSSSKLLDTEEDSDRNFSSSRQIMLWTVGRPDGISRRPDGWQGMDFSDL